jgi:hypothetical protein
MRQVSLEWAGLSIHWKFVYCLHEPSMQSQEVVVQNAVIIAVLLSSGNWASGVGALLQNLPQDWATDDWTWCQWQWAAAAFAFDCWVKFEVGPGYTWLV